MANQSDDVEFPERGYNTEDVRTVAAKPKRRRRWGAWALSLLVLAPVLVFAAWAAVTLSFTYSRGERGPGVVQKFSRKGWVCKTWEGELAMVPTAFGMASEPFRFTVRSDSVATLINRFMREGARVTVHYAQHRGVPGTCFGETQYYVTGAEPVTGPIPGPNFGPGYGPPAPATPPATTPGSAPAAGGTPGTPAPGAVPPPQAVPVPQGVPAAASPPPAAPSAPPSVPSPER